jgi:dTDP-4-dehydrorhamnose reductase
MAQNIIILGSSGRLGKAMAHYFGAHHHVTSFSREHIELESPEAVKKAILPLHFDLLINCAAYTDVDGCESHEKLAYRINAEVVGELSQLCAAKQAKMVHISTDYVFDGHGDQPYTEEDPAQPISRYGQTKLAGEQLLFEGSPDHLILRTSWIIGLNRPSFPEWLIARAMETSEPLPVVADKWASPTRAEDLPVLLDHLLHQPEPASGIFHLTNSGVCSWAEYGRHVLRSAERHQIPIQTSEIREILMSSLTNFVAKRPRYSGLSVKKYQNFTAKSPHHWQEAIDSHVELIANQFANKDLQHS